MLTHIATTATQQSGATVEIHQNMEQITELVKESAVAAQAVRQGLPGLIGTGSGSATLGR